MTSQTNKPWNTKTTPGCNKPGHDEDQVDSAGKKRCKQCRRDYMQRYAKEKHLQRRHQALEAYGGKCAYCGVVEEVFLAIDHINDDGGAHRKAIGASGSATIYKWLERNSYPEGFQVLCHNCNFAKYKNSLLVQEEDESMTQFKPDHKPWSTRTTPGCGRPGHDEDHFSSSGKKSCKQCRREYIRRSDKKRYQRRRSQALEAYGNKCACCGTTEETFLAIDHIEDNGNVHRKELRASGNITIYQWLERNDYPEGFQVLCSNCNYAKSQGICPHQKDQQ